MTPSRPIDRPARPWPLLLLSACATDYDISAKPEANEAGELEAAELPAPESSGISSPDEGCLGGAEVPDAVRINESCAIEVDDGPLHAELEWELPRFSSYGEYSQILMAPLVAQLTDDNGDGVVDRADIPDIIVVTDDEGQRQTKRGILRWLPGDGTSSGAATQRVDVSIDGESYQVYPYRYSNAAVADVNNDGQPEIIIVVEAMPGPAGGDSVSPPAPDGGEAVEDVPVSPGLSPPPSEAPPCFAAAFAVDGSLVWLSMEAALSCGGHAPAIADLEGDGAVEVVIGDVIYAGQSGEVLHVGDLGKGAYNWHPEVGYHAVPADLEGDGLMEIITGRTIYEFTGESRCDFGDDALDGFVAVADFNLDGVGEVISVGDTTGRVFDSRCRETAVFALAGDGNGGMPTVGDFDQDGEPEIGIPTGSVYAVYEASGDIVWAMPVTDQSSAVTGSSAYDFEGDGQLEVVYADETRLWVFDGATGAVRYSSDRHASRTLHELPTVADVDGDEEAEIIIPNGGGHGVADRTGLWVLGSRDGDWMPARSLWNQHAYSITHINDDLSVPRAAPPNWPAYNTFRSGSLLPSTAGEAADVVPLAEVCLDECDQDRLIVTVRLGNSGLGALRPGVPVSIYAQDVSGYRTFRASAQTTGFVGPGETSELLRIAVDWVGYAGQDLVVVGDDDQGFQFQPECDEGNNELLIAAPDCPGSGG